MIRRFIDKIQSGEVPDNYRDPQEFIYGDSRTEESDVYSYGMYFFAEITGKDYFKICEVPEDEFFMMADPDSESSVIDEKYIPEEYAFLSELLKKMTVFRRNMRISCKKVTEILSGFTAEETLDSEKTDEERIPDECYVSASEEHDAYSVKDDYDYGIILNNKRSGRIEFRPLLFHNGKCEKFSVPVEEPGRFVIAVSKRHRDHQDISNPSSVYGDMIIPVGLAESVVDSPKLRISVENSEGKLKVIFDALSSAGNETGKSFQVKWGVR